MININLIIKERPQVNWRRVGVIVAAGSAVAGVGLYALGWWTDYTQVQRELADLGPLAETYRKAVAQRGNLTEQADLLDRQERQLANMGRNQAPSGQSQVLAAVFAAAPPEVAVTEAVIDREQGLLLTGQAADFSSAMRYLQALQALPVLSGVEERKVATAAKGETTFAFAARVRREGRP
ncbi:MAG: hypothetical protein K0R39_3193 [Symbiobacteriaceae bacterium]|jgi:hypothetical protein|nr:hypothetical protein [Symbiobacteriaceae bacterium]